MRFQRKLAVVLSTALLGSGLAAFATPASAALDTYDRNCDGFSGGNGSEANPYRIATAEDLANIYISDCHDEDAYFVQVADIDLSDYEDWYAIGGTGTDWSENYFDAGWNGWEDYVDWNEYWLDFEDNDMFGYGGAYWGDSDYEGSYNFEDDNYFDGQFNGAGFNITGLEISLKPYGFGYNYGLFGGAEDATFENMNISGSVDIQSYYNYDQYWDDTYGTDSEGDSYDWGWRDRYYEGENIGGLVGEAVDTKINNVVSNVDVRGAKYVGGLVGHLISNEEGSYLTNSTATGQIVGDAMYGAFSVGGAVGATEGVVQVRNSAYAPATLPNGDTKEVEIDGDEGENFGGLIGYAGESTVIRNSSSSGDVTGGYDGDTGGLIGYAKNPVVIRSFATGDVKAVEGGDGVGGLIGQVDYNCLSNGLIKGSYATGDVNARTSSQTGGLIGIWDRWDGSCDDGEYAGDLIVDSYATGAVKGYDYVGGLIGDGGPHTILNSYATGAVTAYAYDDSSYAGGLIGYTDEYQSIISSYATGDVTFSDDNAGGLIGYVNDSNSIIDSYATGDLNAVYPELCPDDECDLSSDNVGGLIGEIDAYSLVTRSYATGNVDAWDLDYSENIGGLIGYASDYGILVTSVYATGNVYGEDDIGGLIGNWGGEDGQTLINAYATGDVDGYDYIGGLIGWNDADEDTIMNTYAAGEVDCNYDCDPWGVSDNWYDNTGTNFYVDQYDGWDSDEGVIGVSASELANPLTTFNAGWSIAKNGNWNLTKHWGVCANTNGGLPYLTWQNASDPCPCVAVSIPNIQFKADSAALSTAQKRVLTSAAATIAASKCSTVALAGYTSTLKATAKAKKLAKARVAAVQEFLMDAIWDLGHTVKFSSTINNLNTRNPEDRRVETVALKMVQ